MEEIPHDSTCFTQGLIFVNNIFFESCGSPNGRTSRLFSYRKGSSPIQTRTINPADFGQADIESVFAEGLELVGNKLIQLSWQKNIALVWDLTESEETTFAPSGNTFSYAGEGWGLCDNEDTLVMSNGTGILSFRNPKTFEEQYRLPVKRNGVQIKGSDALLNELECVNGNIWANIWLSNEIVRIDATSGEITGTLNASSLEQPRPQNPTASVLNGIAYDAETDSFWLTGKDWTKLYRIKIS